MKIAKGCRVVLKVDLSIVGGAQLEKSTVEFVQGGGTIPPGLEKVLDGLEKGAKRDGVLKAKDAFGAPSMQPLKKMKRGDFPKESSGGKGLAVGETFVAKGVNDMNVIMKIEKLDGDNVDVRLGHPLAEKDIQYAVEVIEVLDTRPPPIPVQALELEEET